MRRTLDWIVLVALMGGAGYAAYTHQAQVRSVVHMIEGKVAPCANPVTYSIGSIDPRFGISKKILVSDLAEAEAIWEKLSGKNLFGYVADGGDVTVNLVYDSRQASTDKLKAAGIQIDSSHASYDALKAKYDALSGRVRSEQSHYDALVASYKHDQDAYNAEVEHWNQQGGAPRQVYDELQAQKVALAQEFAGLKSFEADMNTDIETLNALATALNQLIVQLNLNVAQYNRAGAAAGEFEEGLYKLKGGIETIDIFEYSDRVQLVRVIAHEMGHALGLEHVGEPGAIMYKINQGESLTASAADITELKQVCGPDIHI